MLKALATITAFATWIGVYMKWIRPLVDRLMGWKTPKGYDTYKHNG